MPGPDMRKPTAHSPVPGEPPRASAFAGSGTFAHALPSQCTASSEVGPKTAQASDGPNTRKPDTWEESMRPGTGRHAAPSQRSAVNDRGCFWPGGVSGSSSQTASGPDAPTYTPPTSGTSGRPGGGSTSCHPVP